MKIAGVICALSFMVGLIYTPPQLPGQSDLNYILNGGAEPTWQYIVATIVCAFSGAYMLMCVLMAPPEKEDQ